MRAKIKRNDSGTIREIPVTVPEYDQETVDWYVQKFFQKMMDPIYGCEMQTAKDWVTGTNSATNEIEKYEIYNAIEDNCRICPIGSRTYLIRK
jgi:hypothetical protein